jgi:hypothetical protein
VTGRSQTAVARESDAGGASNTEGGDAEEDVYRIFGGRDGGGRVSMYDFPDNESYNAFLRT